MKTAFEVNNQWQAWCLKEAEDFGINFSELKDVISFEAKWFGAQGITEIDIQRRVEKIQNQIERLSIIDAWIPWRMKFLQWIIS